MSSNISADPPSINVGLEAMSEADRDDIQEQIYKAIGLEGDPSGRPFRDRMEMHFILGEPVWDCAEAEWFYRITHVELAFLGAFSRKYTCRRVKVVNGVIDTLKLKARLLKLRELQSIENSREALRRKDEAAERFKINELELVALRQGVRLDGWRATPQGLSCQIVDGRYFSVNQALKIQELVDSFDRENSHGTI